MSLLYENEKKLIYTMVSASFVSARVFRKSQTGYHANQETRIRTVVCRAMA